MKLAIIYSSSKLSGKLTKLFTGCYAYHCGWVDEESDTFYDMHLIRRKRYWSEYSKGKEFILVSGFDKVSVDYLEHKLKSDENQYGVKDYILFGFRKIYHLIGKSTPNSKGIICSEMVNNDIWECHMVSKWLPTEAPPSPCDLSTEYIND